MNKDTVLSFFEVEGMPAKEKPANKAAWDSLDDSLLHVKDTENGKYYLVRITNVAPKGCSSIRRLNQSDKEDMKQISTLMGLVSKHFLDKEEAEARKLKVMDA